MPKLKIAIVADPFYSSLSHVIRCVKLFSYLKQSNDIDYRTYLFCYRFNLIGTSIKYIIQTSKENQIIDRIIEVNNSYGKIFNLNDAKHIPEYTDKNQDLLYQEINFKIGFINSLEKDFDKVIVIQSPGFLGSWYLKPRVSKKIENVQILDTIFHPYSRINLGTTWNSQKLAGRLQNFVLDKILYQPMIKPVNSIRKRLGIPQVKSRKDFYLDYWIIDPDIPGYTSLYKTNGKIFQIGPLFPLKNNQFLNQVKEIESFKENSKLIYITLGGSTNNKNFIGFISNICNDLLSLNNFKIIITTGGLEAETEDILVKINDRKRVKIYKFFDARIITKYTEVAVGIMGKEHIMICAQNKCPVVVCPVNLDQETHAKLVNAFGIGLAPVNNSITDLPKSEKLINNVLTSEKEIISAVKKILKNKENYINEHFSEKLSEITEVKQSEQINSIFLKIIRG